MALKEDAERQQRTYCGEQLGGEVLEVGVEGV